MTGGEGGGAGGGDAKEEEVSLSSLHSLNSDNPSSFIAINTGCGRLNVRTQEGRNLHFLQMVVLPLVPILGLIVHNCITMDAVIRYQSDITRINEGVEATVALGMLVAAVQTERLSVAYFIFTNGSMLRSNLSLTYADTDRVVQHLPEWPEITRDEATDIFKTRQHFQIRLNDFRTQVNPSDIYVRDKMAFYEQITKPLIHQLIVYTGSASSPGLWQLVEAYKSIIHATENMGRTVTYGLNYFGRGHIDSRGLYQYVRLWAVANSGIKAMLQFSELNAYKIANVEKQPYMVEIRRWDREVRLNKPINGTSGRATRYITFMARFLDDLRDAQQDLRMEIRATVIEQLRVADSEEAISIAVLVVVLSISPVIVLLVRKFTYAVQVFSDTLAIKLGQLRAEKKRSDRLLYQMLPVTVAKQLRQKKQVPAESFESATVYFSDIVGFEDLCADSSPIQIVTLLNLQYRVFDSRLEKYDVYKVETIGDAYMVASGLPQRNGNKHVNEIGTLALDLRHAVQGISVPHKPGTFLQIRAGVNTGPLVAGVVGTRLPRYCLFGDTVNTASRMETTCEPMRIQVSLSTRNALEMIGGFILEFRGYIEVKGKGEMATYWLEGRDGLQLQETIMGGGEEEGGAQALPDYMHVVADLEATPPELKKDQSHGSFSSQGAGRKSVWCKEEKRERY